MAQIIKTVFQIRRDYEANWLINKDVIPKEGEPCFVIDKNILKIGDGTTTFENLPSIGGVAFDADGTSLVFEDGVLKMLGFATAEVGAQPRKNAEGKIEWVVPSTETVEGLQTSVAGLQSDVKAIQEIVTPKEGDTLLSRVEGLEGKVEVLNGDATIEGSVLKIVKDEINDFATKVSADGTVNSFKELIDYVAAHGPEVVGITNDIATLKTLVGETSVESQIANATVGKVDKVEGKELSSNDFTDSLLDKLNAIEEKAQVNVIEKINVGDSILDVAEKTVNIPIAGIEKAGVVKSSTGANKVNVANDGTMSVNKVSVGSLFVPIGEEFILDGGSASKDAPVYPTRIGNIGFDSIADAVKCADNGDVITLQEDVNMGTGDNDNLVVNAENVTIDFGGKVLTANGSNGAIKVEGGVTTLTGAGTVEGILGSDKYSMAVWANSGIVNIVDGTYTNMTDGSDRGTDLIYASGTATINISGGTFIAAKPEWTLNVKDADYKAGTAKIVVTGGKFKGFDPANNKAEGAGTNFVAEGYVSVLEGEYYVVKPM